VTGKQIVPIAWSIEVPLLGHPTMLATLIKIPVIACGVMGGLLTFLSLALGNRDMIAPLLALTAVSGGVICVQLLFVVIVFFRNRISMSYALDSCGARSRMIDRRAHLGANAAVVAGVPQGEPGVASAGILAQTSADQKVAWRAVRCVDCSPRWRTVKLANAWRTVMVLYCSPENYETAAACVAASVAAQPQRSGGNPVAGCLLRSALMIVGAAPMFYLPRQISVEAFVPFIAFCFGLATVWLLPVFGWAVIDAVAIVFAEAIFNGVRQNNS